MSAIAEIYTASHIKRHRATKADVEHRRNNLLNIVGPMKPATVRQVFYQASVGDIVEKSEAGYAKVQTDLVLMRRAGDLPYHWLADKTAMRSKLISAFGAISLSVCSIFSPALTPEGSKSPKW